jgi:hypothetical protein
MGMPGMMPGMGGYPMGSMGMMNPYAMFGGGGGGGGGRRRRGKGRDYSDDDESDATASDYPPRRSSRRAPHGWAQGRRAFHDHEEMPAGFSSRRGASGRRRVNPGEHTHCNSPSIPNGFVALQSQQGVHQSQHPDLGTKCTWCSRHH